MYKDRVEAGQKLAQKLINFKGDDTVVLALPRGGIVPAAEVAEVLQAPLSLVLVRKIGHPGYSEYAIGAVAEGEKPIYDQSERFSVDKEWLKAAEDSASELIKKRRELYFSKDISQPEISDKTIIIVDDGIATGLSMKAAVLAVKSRHPKQIIVAVPVASSESVAMLKDITDQIIVLDDPNKFLGAVGAHYAEFSQVDDEQVRSILEKYNKTKG